MIIFLSVWIHLATSDRQYNTYWLRDKRKNTDWCNFEGTRDPDNVISQHCLSLGWSWASFIAQSVKNLPAMQETQVRFLGWEDPLEKEMATHSSILAWRIPWTKEPGRLQSMGSQESDTTEWLNHQTTIYISIHICIHIHTYISLLWFSLVLALLKLSNIKCFLKIRFLTPV